MRARGAGFSWDFEIAPPPPREVSQLSFVLSPLEMQGSRDSCSANPLDPETSETDVTTSGSAV